MAIGTAAAIGLAAAGVGSALGASANKKAASKAADTSAQNTAANNALAREIYGKNEGYLGPIAQGGQQAYNTYNALLGIGGGQNAPQMPSQAFSGVAQAMPQPTGPMPYSPAQATAMGFSQANPIPVDQGMAPQGQMPQQGGQISPQSAFDQYRNSTGYQFRLNEGMNALNSNAAAGGWLQSGAALKAGQEYGQNIASQEFGNYLGQVGNSAQMGLGAGSALAGVGQNFVAQTTANNNSASDARANAALIAGQNNPFANALGMVGGGLFSMGMR